MKKAKLVLWAIGFCLVATLPAAAMCVDERAGVVVSFGFNVGEPFTESELNEFDLMRLRQAGVDATSVERWSGCIRAYVRKPDGGQEMRFYDPNTLVEVD